MPYQKFILLTAAAEGGFKENAFHIPEDQRQTFRLGERLEHFVQRFGQPSHESRQPGLIDELHYAHDGMKVVSYYKTDKAPVEYIVFYMKGSSMFSRADAATDLGVTRDHNPREVKRIYGEPAWIDRGVEYEDGALITYRYDREFFWIAFDFLDRTGEMRYITLSNLGRPVPPTMPEPYEPSNPPLRHSRDPLPPPLPSSLAQTTRPFRSASAVGPGAGGLRRFSHPALPLSAMPSPRRLATRATKKAECRGDANPSAAEAGVPRLLLNVQSDPAADALHPEAKALYDAANDDYRATEGRKEEYIKINSGVRSTHEQSDFYIRHRRAQYGGPPAPGANRPGTSKHEYGLAIDVMRKLDEARYTESLTKAGWSNDILDEGWHFEAASIKSWGRIMKAIARIADDLSNRYVEDLVEQLELEKSIKEASEEHSRMVKRTGYLRARLEQLEAYVPRERQRLAAEHRDLQALLSKLSDGRASLSILRRERSGLVFRCPNGQPYGQCTHHDLKRDFDDRKDRLTRAIETMEQDLRLQEAEYRSRDQGWQQAMGELEDKSDQLSQGQRQLEQELLLIEQLNVRIGEWDGVRQLLEANRPAQVQAISDAVAAVRSGASDD